MRNNPERVLEFISLIVIVLFVWFLLAKLGRLIRSVFGFVTIYSFQRGLLYRSGKLAKVLEPGRYLLNKVVESVVVIDMRETIANVVNQEILCADNMAIRMSSSVVYRVSDPVLMNEQTKNALEVLHLDIQLAMRETVAGLKVEEITQKRNEISASVLSMIRPRATAIGLSIQSGGIRDITLPADVKKVFTQVAQAEKAGQAALAKARSEVASLRALANAARMMENNPHLVTLRTLQSVSEIANTSGNTVVFGMPPHMVPMHGHPGAHGQADATATPGATASEIGESDPL